MTKRMLSFFMIIILLISAGISESSVNASSRKYKSRFISVAGKKYYYNASGKLVKNKMFSYKGKKFYAGRNGRIIMGKVFTYRNKKYYAQKKGSLAKNKIITYKGKKYYAGSKYALVKNKKVRIKGKYYYFSKNGVLVTSKTIIISGIKYTADKHGVLKKVPPKSGKEDTDSDNDSDKTDNTDENTTKSPCVHNWVVDKAAHYEWYELRDENGNIVSHEICQACGTDINEFWEELKKEDPSWTFSQALTKHQTLNPSHGSRTANFYVNMIDINGNSVPHPHANQSAGRDTYIPATYKCSKCGDKVYWNYFSAYIGDNLHILQKYGKDTDLTKITWIYEGYDDNEKCNKIGTEAKTVTIGGVTITTTVTE